MTHALWRRAKWMVLLLVACLMLGALCCELNRQLYQHQSPFFDSQSYYIHLFRVMTIAREQGVVAGLSKACFGKTTVCLPFAIAAVIGTVGIEPTRYVAVWIQIAYLYLFLVSVFYYLTKIRGLKPETAALGGLAFLCASCIYFDNGGVSDFRMDLALCLTYGWTVVWYVSAMTKPRLWRFAVFGAAAAACCLSRGTAPIYLIAAFGPLAMIDLIGSEERKSKVAGLALAAVVVAGFSAWFYIGNFGFLHYYYVVWNTDANANIPLERAWSHWQLAWNCIGKYWWRMIIVWTVGLVLTAMIRGQVWKMARSMWVNREIDLRLLWLGICPIAIMILRRAGLNPFVCMPAIIGLMLAIMIPLLLRLDAIGSKNLSRFYWICLVFSIASGTVNGWRRHQPTSFNTMAGQQQILDTLIADSMANNSAKDIRFGVVQVTYLNTQSLYATMLFDRVGATGRPACVEIDGKRFSGTDLFNRGAEADWNMIKGQTVEEKLARLMQAAESQVDYLIVPDEETAKRIQETTSRNVINRYLTPIRSKVVGGNWQRVGNLIQCNELEFVEVYRRSDLK